MIPPMGQAALGIEIVDDNPFLQEVANKLNDPDTYLCTKLERDFIATIGAGCSAPVACNATIDDDIINLEAMIGYPDGTNILRHNLTALVSNCDHLGVQLARDFIDDGALELLQEAQKIAFKDEMPQRL